MFGKQDKMDVRCSSETEANRVSKNGHKEGKESKGSEGNISTSFLKDQQGTFSASAATEGCNKSKSSSADPDYCRRILVRGMSLRCLAGVGEGELRSRPGDGFILSLCLGSGPGLKALPGAPGERPLCPAGLCPGPRSLRLYRGEFPPAARRKVKPRWFLPGAALERASPAYCCFVFAFLLCSFPGVPIPAGSPPGTAVLPRGSGALPPRPRIPPAAARVPWRGDGARKALSDSKSSLCPRSPRARQPRGKGCFKTTTSLKINGGMTKGFLIITF